MPITTRLVLQAVIAGLVAAMALVGVRAVAFAQWGGEPSDPEPQTTPTTSTTDSADPAGTDDPCSLLTQAEAEQALDASATRFSDVLQCTYVADDLSGRAVSVAATGYTAMDGDALSSSTDQLAAALDGTSTPASYGEQSSYVHSDALSQLTILTPQGETIGIVLTGPIGDRAAVTALLDSLAETALSRL